MEMTPLLQLSSLSFRFGSRLIFSDYSLALEPGITWLRGPNGKGKTTLLRLMAGSLSPHAGTIAMDGIDSAAQPLAYRLQSFFCGGDVPDLPWLTVQEFLDIHMALYPTADAARLDAQLDAFGVLQALPQQLATLSLGQHKKVQLALALALPVRLLLVDEPLNGLDAPACAYLRAQLDAREAAGDAWIVLTSHVDPQVAVSRLIDL
ncbi:MAG: ATP-binding cassette domain-containing protein [Telluria sp.]